MVFLYSKQGQLANRLWQAAYFISNAIENNYTFLHLGFGEYVAHYSENISFLKDNYNCYIVNFLANSKKNRIRIKLADILKKSQISFPFVKKIEYLNYSDWYDLSSPSFIKSARKNVVLVDGWFFIDRTAFAKHSELIRKAFTPNKAYIQNVQKHFQKIFLNYKIIVGVHIRRGDYANYRNGIYYYSNMEYRSFMRQISHLPSFINKTVLFVLCSNENINLEDFKGFNTVLSTNHFIEDLYTLSLCDYIIGPPSTFSTWASFYGRIPLLQISHPEKFFLEEDFKVVDSC